MARVPVLYKISTVVDQIPCGRCINVPVLYKISTVVDSSNAFMSAMRSRSLQNFYCCRLNFIDLRSSRSRSLQNFYCCRSQGQGEAIAGFPFFTKFLLLQIWRALCPPPPVPVLYKISTVVDITAPRAPRQFPFFTKFLLLQMQILPGFAANVPVLYKISTVVDRQQSVTLSVFPFFTKFLLLQI